jgi:hypothetical protein
VCRASVTAKYEWKVSRNFNGRTEVETIAKEKRFACVKTVDSWRCR